MPAREWTLAVDFGTSSTSAAATTHDAAHIVEIDGGQTMPSVVCMGDDQLIVGRAADERSSTHPDRVLRAPKRRIDDQGLIDLGGRRSTVQSMIAAILNKTLTDATRSQGSPPTAVVLTHPATWTESTKTRLLHAAAEGGLPPVSLIPEPIAAATSYWRRGELEPGQTIAIYDLGGGTFDTAVLRSTESGFDILGRPRGDESIGGELFDEVALELIESKLDAADRQRLHESDDPAWAASAARLRREARLTKELLSEQPSRDVAVALPGRDGLVVPVTRDELEVRLQPFVDGSIQELRRSIEDAGMHPGDLHAVQLVGGSSKIPIVERSIRAAFPGLDVQRRGDPKAAVALGALSVQGRPRPDLPPPPPPRLVDNTTFDPVAPPSLDEPKPAKKRKWAAIGTGIGIVAVVIALLTWLLPQSPDEDAAQTTTEQTTDSSTTDVERTDASAAASSASLTDPSTALAEPTSTQATLAANPIQLAGFMCIRGASSPTVHVQYGDAGRALDLGEVVPEAAAISPDGTRIAVVVRVDGRRQITVGATNGGETTAVPFGGEASSPTWRPNTSELTFSGRVDGDWGLYSYDVGATSVRVVEDTSSDEENPSWNEDGSLLAFSSNRSGGKDLVYVYDPADSQSSVVNTAVTVDRGLAWATGSSSVVVATTILDVADLVEVFVDGRAERRITESPEVERDPSGVPGERAVLVSVGDTSGAFLRMIELDSARQVDVTAPGSGDAGGQALSANLAGIVVGE